ncbi:hypothetical protein EYC80_006627 [Monilinia laxa]|uniref:Uncharacterized protein n=1 Tax=Monilinia laxa TaxID=61186 RepID=A0A5N6JT98_MONLA|nr:hypothetical protein EYC80_006627 [Monilinia laxa]
MATDGISSSVESMIYTDFIQICSQVKLPFLRTRCLYKETSTPNQILAFIISLHDATLTRAFPLFISKSFLYGFLLRNLCRRELSSESIILIRDTLLISHLEPVLQYGMKSRFCTFNSYL